MMSGQRASEPLRIVGLITHNNRGGAQTALIKLMCALNARGHDTEVWFLYRTCGEHEIEALDPRLFWPRPRPGAGGILRIALDLYRALRQARPDALVSFLPLANVLGQTLAATARIPARVASQRSPGWTYGGSIRMLDKIAGTAGIYGRIVCVSAAVRQSFVRYPAAYRRRLVVTPNGVDLQLTGIDSATARLRFGLPLDAFVVAAVGRLCAEKNLKLLLDAVARAPGVFLVLAGDGEYKAALEKQARELGIAGRVLFLGTISARGVAGLLAGADAFAQPSVYEGHSNALLEAMAAGLPIIASDIPSQREALTDEGGGVCGILLPLDDPETWASALRVLRADAEERLELGRTAVARSGAFTIERMAAGFEAAIMAARADRRRIHQRLKRLAHQAKAGPNSV